jgi:hypothetical protein
MERKKDVIDLGAASIETKGMGGLREDLAIGEPFTGLAED